MRSLLGLSCCLGLVCLASRVEAHDPPPDHLGTMEIKAGIDQVKDQVRACGSQYGAAAGTRVVVKLVIEGSTGSVISATPLDEHAATDLGVCVATVAKTAQFSTFQMAEQRFSFSFRM